MLKSKHVTSIFIVGVCVSRVQWHLKTPAYNKLIIPNPNIHIVEKTILYLKSFIKVQKRLDTLHYYIHQYLFINACKITKSYVSHVENYVWRVCFNSFLSFHYHAYFIFFQTQYSKHIYSMKHKHKIKDMYFSLFLNALFVLDMYIPGTLL